MLSRGPRPTGEDPGCRWPAAPITVLFPGEAATVYHRRVLTRPGARGKVLHETRGTLGPDREGAARGRAPAGLGAGGAGWALHTSPFCCCRGTAPIAHGSHSQERAAAGGPCCGGHVVSLMPPCTGRGERGQGVGCSGGRHSCVRTLGGQTSAGKPARGAPGRGALLQAGRASRPTSLMMQDVPV